MLLKADVAGAGWTGEQIAEAFDRRTRTIEKLRKRFATAGFEQTLHGKQRDKPPTEKILNGKQEARVIALRLGPPPKDWLCQQVVAIAGPQGRRIGDRRGDQP